MRSWVTFENLLDRWESGASDVSAMLPNWLLVGQKIFNESFSKRSLLGSRVNTGRLSMSIYKEICFKLVWQRVTFRHQSCICWKLLIIWRYSHDDDVASLMHRYILVDYRPMFGRTSNNDGLGRALSDALRISERCRISAETSGDYNSA